MSLTIACTIVFVSVLVGILVTRQMVTQRRKQQLAARLAGIINDTISATSETPLVLTQPTRTISTGNQLVALKAPLMVQTLTKQSGVRTSADQIILSSAIIATVAFSIAFVLQVSLPLSLLCGFIPASLPFIYLYVKRARMRKKFTEQLPDAIDLMVSVLRSGHSVPQAIRTVGSEISHPCGTEFIDVLQRMNLGQPLPEALTYSVYKLASYELDLIRRAISIQSEVGGSLAELLDRTNQSLRQRLKLVRQVNILTSQSRLTAVVVGLMPFIVACALETLNPGYLSPLFDTEIGKLFISVALFLEVLGIIIMKKMSTVKV